MKFVVEVVALRPPHVLILVLGSKVGHAAVKYFPSQVLCCRQLNPRTVLHFHSVGVNLATIVSWGISLEDSGVCELCLFSYKHSVLHLCRGSVCLSLMCLKACVAVCYGNYFSDTTNMDRCTHPTCLCRGLVAVLVTRGNICECLLSLYLTLAFFT